MSYHDKTKEEVLNCLDTVEDKGLSSSKVNELKVKFGPNRLQEKKKKTNLRRFLDQFKDVMIIILIIAALVSFAIVVYEKKLGRAFRACSYPTDRRAQCRYGCLSGG